MAPQQHQATGRQFQDIITKKHASNKSETDSKIAFGKTSDQGHFQAADPAAYEDNFHDSGFLDCEESAVPDANNYKDFTLFDDPPFIEENASMYANHGSIYNGANNERAANIQRFTSYNYDERPIVRFRETAAGSITQTANEAAHGGRPPPREPPSLFSDFESSTGPSMLSQWAATAHRHEIIAYRYEQPSHPTDHLQSPTPPAKQRRSKSKTHIRQR